MLPVHKGGHIDLEGIVRDGRGIKTVPDVAHEIKDAVGKGDHRFIDRIFYGINPLQQGIVVYILTFCSKRNYNNQEKQILVCSGSQQ